MIKVVSKTNYLLVFVACLSVILRMTFHHFSKTWLLVKESSTLGHQLTPSVRSYFEWTGYGIYKKSPFECSMIIRTAVVLCVVARIFFKLTILLFCRLNVLKCIQSPSSFSYFNFDQISIFTLYMQFFCISLFKSSCSFLSDLNAVTSLHVTPCNASIIENWSTCVLMHGTAANIQAGFVSRKFINYPLRPWM